MPLFNILGRRSSPRQGKERAFNLKGVPKKNTLERSHSILYIRVPKRLIQSESGSDDSFEDHESRNDLYADHEQVENETGSDDSFEEHESRNDLYVDHEQVENETRVTEASDQGKTTNTNFCSSILDGTVFDNGTSPMDYLNAIFTGTIVDDFKTEKQSIDENGNSEQAALEDEVEKSRTLANSATANDSTNLDERTRKSNNKESVARRRERNGERKSRHQPNPSRRTFSQKPPTGKALHQSFTSNRRNEKSRSSDRTSQRTSPRRSTTRAQVYEYY